MNQLIHILPILLIGISNFTYAQTETKMSGKILDEKLNCLFGVKVTNVNTGADFFSDQNGNYELIVRENDTLQFRYVGYTTDRIKIENLAQSLDVIMINKEVNCLGADLSEKLLDKLKDF